MLVPTRHFATTKDAIDSLRREDEQYGGSNNLQIMGMETTEKSQIYTNINYKPYYNNNNNNSSSSSSSSGNGGGGGGGGGVALILGNEVTGVDTNIMDDLDAIIEIPTFGAKNSLNVAACAPVVLYEILRQWNVSNSSDDG